MLRFTLISILLLCLMPLSVDGLRAQDRTNRPAVSVVTDARPLPATVHGIAQLKAALEAKKVKFEEAASVAAARGDVVVVAGLGAGSGPAGSLVKTLQLAPPDGKEAILIHSARQNDKKLLLVAGGDDRGVMYALLDVAERIGWADGADPLAHVRDVREKPAVAERGVSMHAMQQAYFEARLFNEDYWDRYFSMLASNRFNTYVMIFGYENAGFLAPPYPYFCDVDGFADVHVVGLGKDQQKRNLDALKRVIRQAHAHGIHFRIGIWDHIYRGGVQTGGAKQAKAGRPGTVSGVTEKNLVTYTRTAFTTLMQKLPDLDSVQFRMHDESGLKQGAEMRQFWTSMFDDLKRSGRDLRFELRAKAMPDDIIDAAVNSGIDFRLSTRYWTEQMGLPFHPTHINRQNQFDRRHSYADLLRYPQRYPMLWQLWTGGTTRILLWGDPEYVRRFTESTHLYDGEGFTVYEPLTTKMASHDHDQKPVEILTPEYRYYDFEFERYWHWFQCFGRIGYNPQTPPEVWKKQFELRFGKEAAPHLEAALHRASQVLPRINATIFPYSHFATTYGWAEKQRKGDLPFYAKADVSDTQQFLTMEQAAQLMMEGGESAKVWPEQTSEWFSKAGGDILKYVAMAERQIGKHRSKEYVSTITDLRILAHLAQFHGVRLKAGVWYALYKQSKDLNALDIALIYEEQAIKAWTELVNAAGTVYAPDLMMGRADQGLSGHWKDELAALHKGLAALQKERKAFQPAPGIAHVPMRKIDLPGNPAIQATVGPADSNGELRLVYRSSKGEWQVLPMKSLGPPFWQVQFPPTAAKEGAALEYYLELTDGGKTITLPPEGKNKPFAVTVTRDWSPPQVVHSSVTKAQAGKPLTVTAKVTDPSGVKWVRLLYRDVNQKLDYKALPMTPAAEKDTYVATIPGEAITSTWDVMYLIEAMDNRGNGRIYPDLEKETPYVMVRVERR
jgi:hypothetical protein